MVKIKFYSFAAHIRKILFSPLHDKIRILNWHPRIRLISSIHHRLSRGRVLKFQTGQPSYLLLFLNYNGTHSMHFLAERCNNIYIGFFIIGPTFKDKISIFCNCRSISSSSAPQLQVTFLKAKSMLLICIIVMNFSLFEHACKIHELSQIGIGYRYRYYRRQTMVTGISEFPYHCITYF